MRLLIVSIVVAMLTASAYAKDGKVKVQDMNLTHQYDKSSPTLAKSSQSANTKSGTTPRDAGSGLATGKRMHKPY